MKKSDKNHPSASGDANPDGRGFFFLFLRVSLLLVLELVNSLVVNVSFNFSTIILYY